MRSKGLLFAAVAVAFLFCSVSAQAVTIFMEDFEDTTLATGFGTNYDAIDFTQAPANGYFWGYTDGGSALGYWNSQFTARNQLGNQKPAISVDLGNLGIDLTGYTDLELVVSIRTPGEGDSGTEYGFEWIPPRNKDRLIVNATANSTEEELASFQGPDGESGPLSDGTTTLDDTYQFVSFNLDSETTSISLQFDTDSIEEIIRIGSIEITGEPASVPEPATLLLLGFGLATLGLLGRRKET